MQLISWRQAIPEVHAVNPMLSRNISGLDISGRMKVLKVEYPFVSNIVHAG